MIATPTTMIATPTSMIATPTSMPATPTSMLATPTSMLATHFIHLCQCSNARTVNYWKVELHMDIDIPGVLNSTARMIATPTNMVATPTNMVATPTSMVPGVLTARGIFMAKSFSSELPDHFQQQSGHNYK